jgi:hypothetical protein
MGVLSPWHGRKAKVESCYLVGINMLVLCTVLSLSQKLRKTRVFAFAPVGRMMVTVPLSLGRFCHEFGLVYAKLRDDIALAQ